MRDQIRIHEIVRDNHLERDEWYLVREAGGRNYVLYEGLTARPGPDAAPTWKKHRLAVKTVLAQDNELSRKLKMVLEA